MIASLSREQARAADVVEAMYAAAQKIKAESNPRLWDPRANPTLRRVVLENALVLELGERYRDAWMYDREYTTATEVLAPLIRRAAAKWTLASLEKQAMNVGKVKLFAGQQPHRLHTAATQLIRQLSTTQKKGFTSSELKAITGESGNAEGGSVPERLDRVTYMRTVIDLRDESREKSWEDKLLAYENLHRLMVHPRGVQLVNAFARSSERGRDYAVETIEESERAIIGMRGDIAEDASMIWRFPVAITAGVGNIGLGPRPGITAFALEWAKWGEQSGIDRALDIAGNALLALELVGGPIGALISEVLDFVMGVIGTAVQFVRDLEQDQAGKASAFAPNGDRLSEGSSFASTALMGATTFVAAFLPVAVTQVGKHAGKPVKRLVVDVEKRSVAAADVPDARALSKRGVDDTGAKATDRLADNARRTGDNGTITTGKTADATTQTNVIDNNGTSSKGVTASGGGNNGVSGNGTGGNGAGGKGTGGNGVGGPPPTPPGARIGRANTRTPGVDNRTAAGGIKFVHEWKENNKRVVEVVGEINLINGPTPDSIFRNEWPSAELLGLPGYDRCHLFPLQWGDEAAAGFMYAHGDQFNRSFQKQLENYVRRFRDAVPSYMPLQVRVKATTGDRATFGGNLLETIEYEFSHPGSKQVTTIKFKVEPPPSGRVKPAAEFEF